MLLELFNQVCIKIPIRHTQLQNTSVTSSKCSLCPLQIRPWEIDYSAGRGGMEMKSAEWVWVAIISIVVHRSVAVLYPVEPGC